MEASLKPRLNFVIPEDLDDTLASYCEETGRSQSEVIRQVVLEWLDGDRRLPAPARVHPSGRRTNMQLSHVLRGALEAKIKEEGHGTISAVIEALLRSYVAHRGNGGDGTTIVRVALPTGVYDELFVFCQRWGWTVADGLKVLAESPERFERLVRYALEKEA